MLMLMVPRVNVQLNSFYGFDGQLSHPQTELSIWRLIDCLPACLLG